MKSPKIFKFYFDMTEPGRTGAFKLIEVDVPSFDYLLDLIEEDVLIRGNSIWTTKSDSTVKTIETRRPIAFRGGSVLRVENSSWEFVEAA